MKLTRWTAVLLVLVMGLYAFTGCGLFDPPELSGDTSAAESEGATSSASSGTQSVGSLRMPAKIAYTLYGDETETRVLQLKIKDGVLTTGLNTSGESSEITLDKDGRVIKEILYNEDGSVDQRTEYEYDAAGNLIKELQYDKNTGSVDAIRKYEYDQDGNETKYLYYNIDGTVHASRTYETEYDGNGVLTKRSCTDNDGRTVCWEYDGSGKLTRSIQYDSDGNISDILEYDANGNEAKRVSYNADGSMDGRYEYTYNANGNMIQEIGYGRDGVLYVRMEYEYDKYGRVTKFVSYDGDGNVETQEEHTYTYDANGNLTQEFHGNQSLSYRWDRAEYTYDQYGHASGAIWYTREGNLYCSIEIVEYATAELTQAQADYIWDTCRWTELDFF